MDTTLPRPVRSRPAAPLRGYARDFFGHPSPRLLAAALSTSIVLRIVVGGWRVRDLVVVAGFLGAQPFVEWLIHVYVLHWRPRVIWGRTVDPYIGRSHRMHHRDPKNAALIFIHIRAVQGGLVLAVLGWWAAFTVRPSWGTAVLASQALTLVYEWTHFLIHSDYVPRHRWYRALWRTHRLHHFRNESYWYGVTMHLGDRVLRTYPDKDAVPLSTTATTMEQFELV